ncbi:hypothetical protein LIER_40478 [Lithospermum erythrorhizon]|uniref:Uncharacterized protein n=1 Tax=Lithospermum erythrorhizon TaxID=34254 RepID=A0AAV3QYB6_LITER
MEAELARIIEEKYQFSLVGKVLTKKTIHGPTFKDTIRALWGGQEGMQVLDIGFNLFHYVSRISNSIAHQVAHRDPGAYGSKIPICASYIQQCCTSGGSLGSGRINGVSMAPQFNHPFHTIY